MPETVIPDTSCLIGLQSGGVLDLLHRLYPHVVVPSAVIVEFGEPTPVWISVAPVNNIQLVQALRSSLGPGESEVIALSLEHVGAVAVLDDSRARRTGRDLGVRFTGTVGILLRAKAEGVLLSVSSVLDTMARSGFRLSPALRREVLRLASEDKD